MRSWGGRSSWSTSVHESVMAWASQMVTKYDLAGLSTLEVGSLDVNGSVRGLFTGPYWGIDQCDGPGVDRVGDAEHLPILNVDGYVVGFELVVSTELLEHCERFWVALAEMGRVLRPGGMLMLSVRGWTPEGAAMFEHSYPSDYWRFGRHSVPLLVGLAGCDVVESMQDPQVPGFMALGRKRGS